MTNNTPSSLTVEEAVAMMINLESIPNGMTVDSYLKDILEDSEIAHHEAERKGISENEVEMLERRKTVCRNRHNLAIAINKSLSHEVANTLNDTDSILKKSSDSGITIKLTIESVREWSLETFGILISTDPRSQVMPHNTGLTYRTKQLDALDDAIAEFCENSTVKLPKGEYVANWIHKKYPFVSIKTAEQMCRIMQPD